MFLYRRHVPRKSYSLASRDGQPRALPRTEVISIVFINLSKYISKYSLTILDRTLNSEKRKE